MRNYDLTKARLLKEQNGLCWICRKPLREDAHVHHAVISRDKRFAEWLDQPENLILVCSQCHGNHGRLSNYNTRKAVLDWKVKIGYQMREWLESIPMKVKERFDDRAK